VLNKTTMFSNKTSRSHSVSSVNSVERNETNDDHNEQPETAGTSGTGHVSREHYNFTKNHPQGAALLKLVEDLTNLARKTGVKQMATNIDDFCTSFHNSVRLERDRTADIIENSNQDIEMSLIQKELNSHKINASIELPNYFSPTPTINSTQRQLEVQKIFPKQGKFSGTHRDGNMGVVEFLRSMVAAQNQCGLSEEEFINRLLDSSTGPAHDLILEWKTNGMDSAGIFHNLLLNYDRRLTAEEARNQMIGYKVPRNSNLAAAEAHIVKLIGRAATAMPTGPTRNDYYNLEGCNALIRALPPYSSQQASQVYNNLTAKLGRACTLLELSLGLNLQRTNIDKDIKENGATDYTRNKRFGRPMSFRKPRFTSYTVGMTPTRSTSMPTIPKLTNPSTNFTPRPNHTTRGRGGVRRYNGPPSTRSTTPNAYNYRAPAPRNNFGNTGYRRQGFGRRPMRPPYVVKKCILCGYRSHETKDCNNMRDDHGNQKTVIPMHGTCPKCPRFIFPRLHHPQDLCPFRKGGPLDRDNKNKN